MSGRKNNKKQQNKQQKQSAVKVIVGRGAYKPKGHRTGSAAPGVAKVRGRGGFFSDLWSGVKDVARFIPEGVKLFQSISPLLAGFGTYRVNKNTFLNNQSNMESGFPTNQAPSFASCNVGSDIVLSHREFVVDIKSSINFTKQKFMLNPGNPVLFPWLNQIAMLYEEYEFLGVVFEFKSTSATAVGTTSSAMGSVVMATDYDCEDNNFYDKRTMEAAEYATSGQPFQSFIHPIECDPKRNVIAKLFIQPGVTDIVDLPGDPRFSMHGVTTVATIGQQIDGTSIGELWVSYHVRLSRPILETIPRTYAYGQHIGGVVTSGTGGVFSQSINQGAYGKVVPTFAGTGSTLRCTLTCADSRLIGMDILMTARATRAGASTFYASTSPPLSVVNGTSLLPIITTTAGVPNTYADATRASQPDTTLGLFATDTTTCAFRFLSVNDGVSFVVPVSTSVQCGYDIYLSAYSTASAVSSRKKVAAPSVRDYNMLLDRLERVERGDVAAAAAADPPAQVAVRLGDLSPDCDCEIVGGAPAASSNQGLKPLRPLPDIEDIARYRTKR